MKPPHPKHQVSLDEILADIWSELTLGKSQADHGFHLPVLATVDEHGAPTARIVVLRACDAQSRVLRCHTDRRAPKVAHIERQPKVALNFYDPVLRVQLRVTGQAVVRPIGDAIATAAWESASLGSRRCYLAPDAPSVVSKVPTANLPDALLTRHPTVEESRSGQMQFAVVETQVSRIDWLRLRYDGHRRAQFAWDKDGNLEASWITP